MRFLMREQGSGTLEVIEHALKPFEIKLSQLSNRNAIGKYRKYKILFDEFRLCRFYVYSCYKKRALHK